MSADLDARLWSRVVVDDNGCWLWQGAKNSHGYGTIRRGEKNDGCHRVAYEAVKGPIPEGLQIDHLCRVRHCINPDHLEAVTVRENILRGTAPAATLVLQTHCKRGHALTGDNVYVWRRMRACRTCRRLAAARRKEAACAA